MYIAFHCPFGHHVCLSGTVVPLFIWSLCCFSFKCTNQYAFTHPDIQIDSCKILYFVCRAFQCPPPPVIIRTCQVLLSTGRIFISVFRNCSRFQWFQAMPRKDTSDRFWYRPLRRANQQLLNHQPPSHSAAQFASRRPSLSLSGVEKCILLWLKSESWALPEYPFILSWYLSRSPATRNVL